jgi:WD40 repeat protein
MVLGPAGRFAAVCCTAGAAQGQGVLVRDLHTQPLRDRFFALKAQACGFSPDGRYLACGNREGVISLLRLSERGKVPEPQVPAPTARELAERPNAADALKAADVPEAARAYVGGGDPKKAPPELVAVWAAAPAPLADTRFRCPKGAGRPAFSPDGKLLAVPSEGMVLFFEISTGRLVRSAKGLWDLRARVAFSPNGRKLAVGSKAEDFRLLDVGTGKALWRLKETTLATVDGFAFSADGKQIAFRSNSSIEVREVGTGRKVRSFRGPGKKIVSMAFTTDPTYLASVALGAVNPWQVNVHSRDVPRGGYGTQFSHLGVRVAFSPDGKLLAIAHKEEKGGTYMVSYYRPDDRFREACGFQPIPGADVLFFTPDGKELVAAAFQGGNVVIGRGQAPTGKLFERKTVVLPRTGPVEWAVSPDGKTLAVSVKGDPFVRLIDVATGKLHVSDAEHTGAVIALASSADGKRLVSAWEDGRVIVWDLATGRRIVRWKLDSRLRRLAISPDGRVVATACKAPANSATQEDWLHLWDANGGIATRFLSGHAGEVTDLAFSPDGKLLATASTDRTVRLWGVQSGKGITGVVHPQKVQAVAWSADSRLLASWSTDGTWIVLNVVTRTEHRHTDQTLPWSAAFDLEGRHLAVLGVDGGRPFVGLYKWKGNEAGRGMTPPRSRLKGMTASALGPGPFLAAATSRLDNTLLVWQTKLLPNPSRERRFTLAPPGSGPLRCVVFSPEGRYVLAGGADGLIRVLRLAERGKVPEFPLAQ